MKLIPWAIGILMSVSFAAISLAQNSPISTPDERHFANYLFNGNLFNQIPITCEANQLGRFCSYIKRYIFKDIVLVIEEQASDNITLTVTPVEPVSVDRALSYAKILVSSQRVNYDSPSNQTQNRIIYRGCKLGISDYYSCTTILTLNSDRRVIEIIHISYSE